MEKEDVHGTHKLTFWKSTIKLYNQERYYNYSIIFYIYILVWNNLYFGLKKKTILSGKSLHVSNDYIFNLFVDIYKSFLFIKNQIPVRYLINSYLKKCWSNRVNKGSKHKRFFSPPSTISTQLLLVPNLKLFWTWSAQ